MGRFKHKIIDFIHLFVLASGFNHLLSYLYRKQGYYKIPVLVYHSVGDKIPSQYNISIDSFEKQIQFIYNKFEVIRLKDLLLLEKKNLNFEQKRYICVTFDDALRSIYINAAKILNKYNIPYTIFIPTNFIGNKPNWVETSEPVMSIDELKDLDKSGLVDFGAHTMDHVLIRNVGMDEFKRQVIGSKKSIELILNKQNIDLFAYPYGGFEAFSPQTTQLLYETGFRLAVTTVPGIMNSNKNLLKLKRISLTENDSEKKITAKLNGNYDWYVVKNWITYFTTRLFNR